MKRIFKNFLAAVCLSTLVGVSGCKEHTPPTPTTATPTSIGHHHVAPHGGTLIGFGEEFAHLELLLDASTGELTGYVLDGEAENAVRLESGGLALTVQKAEGETPVDIILAPMADELTGETAESTSRFVGRSDSLKDATSFKGTVKQITVKGSEFKEVEFSFPQGNEESGHDHDEDQDHHHEDHDHDHDGHDH